LLLPLPQGKDTRQTDNRSRANAGGQKHAKTTGDSLREKQSQEHPSGDQMAQAEGWANFQTLLGYLKRRATGNEDSKL